MVRVMSHLQARPGGDLCISPSTLGLPNCFLCELNTVRAHNKLHTQFNMKAAAALTCLAGGSLAAAGAIHPANKVRDHVSLLPLPLFPTSNCVRRACREVRVQLVTRWCPIHCFGLIIIDPTTRPLLRQILPTASSVYPYWHRC